MVSSYKLCMPAGDNKMYAYLDVRDVHENRSDDKCCYIMPWQHVASKLSYRTTIHDDGLNIYEESVLVCLSLCVHFYCKGTILLRKSMLINYGKLTMRSKFVTFFNEKFIRFKRKTVHLYHCQVELNLSYQRNIFAVILT